MAGNSFELDQEYEWNGSVVRWTALGTGPPVVLCHGTPWSSLVWRNLVRALAQRWTIHLWDMIGFGVSDKPDGDVSLAAQGALLHALAEHWGLQHPHVIAHDIGGAVALRSHLLHGLPMRSLVLIDVVALRPWGSPFFRLVSDNPDVFAALPGDLHEALLRQYITGASMLGLPDDVLDELAAPWLGARGQAAFYRQIAQADEGHTAVLELRLGDIDFPTLVVWGTADAWIPVDHARRLTDAIPGSRMHLIEGAGHLVQEDRPAALVDTVRVWLDSQAD